MNSASRHKQKTLISNYFKTDSSRAVLRWLKQNWPYPVKSTSAYMTVPLTPPDLSSFLKPSSCALLM